MSQEIKNDNAKDSALAGYLSIEYESVSAKELDELREKAEAFDFLSSLRFFERENFGAIESYLVTELSESKGETYTGETLLDCVKQARECEEWAKK